jgi:hypothetical protein
LVRLGPIASKREICGRAAGPVGAAQCAEHIKVVCAKSKDRNSVFDLIDDMYPRAAPPRPAVLRGGRDFRPIQDYIGFTLSLVFAYTYTT